MYLRVTLKYVRKRETNKSIITVEDINTRFSEIISVRRQKISKSRGSKLHS